MTPVGIKISDYKFYSWGSFSPNDIIKLYRELNKRLHGETAKSRQRKIEELMANIEVYCKVHLLFVKLNSEVYNICGTSMFTQELDLFKHLIQELSKIK